MPLRVRASKSWRRAAWTAATDSRRGAAVASSSRAIARKRWRQVGRRSMAMGKRSFMTSSLVSMAREIRSGLRMAGSENPTARCAFKHSSLVGADRDDVGDDVERDGGEEGDGDDGGENHGGLRWVVRCR